jgi:glyoxylase-like metal-dependent hydrolase (beta-lactamase superfamily II)
VRPRAVNAGNAGPFTLDGTRTFLVGDRDVAVIDPGPEVDSHLGALLSALDSAVRVHVVVTHWHGDHADLAERLAQELGGVPVHGPGPRADVSVADGDRLLTDAGPLVALSTPGHAREHVALHHPDSGSLFVGDLLLGEGDTTWVGEYEESVGDYLESLQRVRALSPRVLFPTHGPEILDVPDALDRYEAHRRSRIEQVRAALTAAPQATPEELMERVYGVVPGGLGGAAMMSLRATLHYLRSG